MSWLALPSTGLTSAQLSPIQALTSRKCLLKGCHSYLGGFSKHIGLRAEASLVPPPCLPRSDLVTHFVLRSASLASDSVFPLLGLLHSSSPHRGVESTLTVRDALALVPSSSCLLLCLELAAPLPFQFCTSLIRDCFNSQADSAGSGNKGRFL